MKLTNTIRDAYIHAIMADVPSTDYTAQSLKIAQDDNVAQLPPAVRAIATDPKLSHHLETRWRYEYLASFRSFGRYDPSDKARAKLAELHALAKVQDESRNALQAKLRALAYSVTTRAALLAAAPEFEKYLPEDEGKAVRNLPAVQNVVADLVAAGWPKDAKKLKVAK